MNTKTLILAATFMCLLLVVLGDVAAAQDIEYIADPPHVAVSPSTVIPDGLPTATLGSKSSATGRVFLRRRTTSHPT
jgi:hypothetical protein